MFGSTHFQTPTHTMVASQTVKFTEYTCKLQVTAYLSWYQDVEMFYNGTLWIAVNIIFLRPISCWATWPLTFITHPRKCHVTPPADMPWFYACISMFEFTIYYWSYIEFGVTDTRSTACFLEGAYTMIYGNHISFKKRGSIC